MMHPLVSVLVQSTANVVVVIYDIELVQKLSQTTGSANSQRQVQRQGERRKDFQGCTVFLAQVCEMAAEKIA